MDSQDDFEDDAAALAPYVAVTSALSVTAVLHGITPGLDWTASISIGVLVGLLIVGDVVVPIGPSRLGMALRLLDRLLGRSRRDREYHLSILIYLAAVVLVSIVTDVVSHH